MTAPECTGGFGCPVKDRLEHPLVETTTDQGSGAWRSQLMVSSRDVKNRVGQARD